MVKLVIKLEPLENVKNLVIINNQSQIQKEYGKKVAENLYNFMVSFHKEYNFNAKWDYTGWGLFGVTYQLS